MGTRERYDHGVFNWVDLMAHDMGAAAEFYGGLFGWTAEPQETDGDHRYTMFRQGGHAVAGLGEASAEMKAAGVPARWNTYVAVDDAEAAFARATEAGATAMMPVMKVMDVGWMTFLTDPEGASFAIWQAGSHPGAGLVNEPGTFVWSELNTHAPTDAMAFYGAVFGWDYEPMEHAAGGYQLVKVGGRPVGGMLTLGEACEVPAAWTVYFNIADLDAAVARVGDLGGKVLKPAFDTPVGSMAVVADRDGACLSLIQAHRWDD